MDALRLPAEFRHEIAALLGAQADEFWRAYDRPHWRALRLNPRIGLRPGPYASPAPDNPDGRRPAFALSGVPGLRAAAGLGGVAGLDDVHGLSDTAGLNSACGLGDGSGICVAPGLVGVTDLNAAADLIGVTDMDAATDLAGVTDMDVAADLIGVTDLNAATGLAGITDLDATAKGLDAARALARRYIDRPVPWQPGAYYIAGDSMPGASLMHLMGLYYIQEPSAMAAGAALAVKPGMRVLDLCAAPGGKSSQLAAALAGKGLLVSNEPIPARARMLAGNIERQGFTNVVVTNEYPDRLAARWGEAFDAILVDAPCSGEGMFRRDEGALHEWTPDAPRACHLRQLDILDSAHALLKPGGALVYSTCTFNRLENEGTIGEFLRRYPDMAPEDFALAGLGASRDGMLRLWPHIIDGEGHFVCRLRRHAGSDMQAHPSYDEARAVNAGRTAQAIEAATTPTAARAGRKDGVNRKGRNSHASRLAADTSRRGKSSPHRPDAHNDDAARALRQLTDELPLPELHGEAVLYGAQLHLLPPDCPPLDGVRVALAGLGLAEVGRSHVAPAYALCRALAPGAGSVEVDTQAALRLVRGEQIERAANDGWVLLHWHGLPVCPGKARDGIVKGHYPRGLKPLGTIAEEAEELE